MLGTEQCSINTDRVDYRKGGGYSINTDRVEGMPRRSKCSLYLQLKSITPIGMTDFILSNSSCWKKFAGKQECL